MKKAIYVVTVKYEEPWEVAGWKQIDYTIRFDDVEQLSEYLKGNAAYDYVDACYRLNSAYGEDNVKHPEYVDHIEVEYQEVEQGPSWKQIFNILDKVCPEWTE